MKKKRMFIGVMILMILFGGGVGIFFKSALASEFASLPKRFQQLRDIYLIISNFYVEDVDPDVLVNAAIQGMIDELDPFSTYMEPEEYEDFQTDMVEGTFGGIGIRITIRDDQLTIVAPLKNTPGEAIGLQGGDMILEVDGQSTEGISTETAVQWMRGEPGTKVTIKVQREGMEEPKEYEIIRGLIEVPFTDSEVLDDNIGYVYITQFGAGVGRDVEKAMAEFAKQGVEGVVLDLRNNPGGLLTEAVNVFSVFQKSGPVVHVRQREGVSETLRVNRFIKHYDLPLVVMINGGSASASEIVAGAVQDTGVGTLLGTKSFGKGTVQQVIPLEDGSAFKITTARYYTPNDRFIHEEGIEPDVIVEFDADLAEQEIDNQLEEAKALILEQIQQEGAALKPAS